MAKAHSTADSNTTRHKEQHLEVSCLQWDETEYGDHMEKYGGIWN